MQCSRRRKNALPERPVSRLRKSTLIESRSSSWRRNVCISSLGLPKLGLESVPLAPTPSGPKRAGCSSTSSCESSTTRGQPHSAHSRSFAPTGGCVRETGARRRPGRSRGGPGGRREWRAAAAAAARGTHGRSAALRSPGGSAVSWCCRLCHLWLASNPLGAAPASLGPPRSDPRGGTRTLLRRIPSPVQSPRCRPSTSCRPVASAGLLRPRPSLPSSLCRSVPAVHTNTATQPCQKINININITKKKEKATRPPRTPRRASHRRERQKKRRVTRATGHGEGRGNEWYLFAVVLFASLPAALWFFLREGKREQ